VGLATVYGIVTQSEGTITVDSAPGQGTRVTISLPRVDATAEPLEAGPASAGAPQGEETILLVEDYTEIREMLQEILQLHGYTVLTAANGQEALRSSERHEGTIQLLLTDVIMPGMSGRELADHVTRKRPSMKVLFMSGYTEDELGQHGLLDPGVTLLRKPFLPEALVEKVREILDTPPPPGGDSRA